MLDLVVRLGLVTMRAALGNLGTVVAQDWSLITPRVSLDIFIEDDPSVFRAGKPNWDDFVYVITGTTIIAIPKDKRARFPRELPAQIYGVVGMGGMAGMLRSCASA